MSTKENKKRPHWIAVIAAVAMMGMVSVSCAPKESGDSQEATEQSAAEIHQEEIAKQGEQETVAEEAAVEETTEAEIQTYETAMDWAMTVDRTIPKATIWNSITKEGEILENGQKYFVKEGDWLVICGEFIGRTSIFSESTKIPDIVQRNYATSIHFEYEIIDIPDQEILLEIDPVINNQEYDLSVILTSENAVPAAEGTVDSKELSGFEWAISLEIDEPKLLVWNDETGVKKIIENGERYELQEGDVIAGRKPSDWMIYDFEPHDFAGVGELVSKNMMISRYILPDESKEINFIMETTDGNGVDVEFKYIIVTP